MLARQGNIEHRSDAMELRRIIPSDITASAIAHVSLLTLFVLFSEVHPFGAVTAEQIPVEIVDPAGPCRNSRLPAEQPPAETQAGTERRTRTARFLAARQAALPPPRRRPAPPAPAARPQKQARSPRRARQPPPSQQVAPPPSQPAAPAYKPPEPDVSIKYQVLLGLPPDLVAVAAASRAGSTRATTISTGRRPRPPISPSTLIAAFRRHLKTCSKLPASLSGADDVKVKLRVLMTLDGRLAAEPILIEASASMKGRC